MLHTRLLWIVEYDEFMMLNAWLWSRLWHIFGYCPPQDNNKTLEAQLCELTKSTPSPTCPPTSPTAVFVNIKRAYIDNSIIRKGMCVYLCASCLLDSRRLLNYEWWKEEFGVRIGTTCWLSGLGFSGARTEVKWNFA